MGRPLRRRVRPRAPVSCRGAVPPVPSVRPARYVDLDRELACPTSPRRSEPCSSPRAGCMRSISRWRRSWTFSTTAAAPLALTARLLQVAQRGLRDEVESERHAAARQPPAARSGAGVAAEVPLAGPPKIIPISCISHNFLTSCPLPCLCVGAELSNIVERTGGYSDAVDVSQPGMDPDSATIRARRVIASGLGSAHPGDSRHEPSDRRKAD